MAGLTITNANLAATFSCTLMEISPTDATMEMSTISYSSPAVAVRASTTHFWSNYQETSRTISVFTRNDAEMRPGGRFVTPLFPQSTSARCSGFQQHNTRNSLVRLLANTAAEVAYFNRERLTDRLVIKARYIRAGMGLARRDGGALLKLVIADSRLNLVRSKQGEFVHWTEDSVRYTRLEKYEMSDIAAGTLVVFVTLRDPFPFALIRESVFIQNLYLQVPQAFAKHIRTVYGTPEKCPFHIMRLVEYIDLCLNPIVDGLPDQEEYLRDIWLKKQNLSMVMDQLMVGVEAFDQSLLSNVLGFLGAMMNTYLDENLSSIALRLRFTRERIP